MQGTRDCGDDCDDCLFDFAGDMLTPAELRSIDLHDPTNRLERDQWLAQYNRAGIADDQDPGLFEFWVEGSGDAQEIVDITRLAHQLRMMTPDD